MKGSVRRSQLITTYGVGSIVAVEDESVMVMGLDEWPPEKPGEELAEPRLHIDGKRLRLPPGGDGGVFGVREKHIPVTRFPAWYYCSNPACRRLGSFGHLSLKLTTECGKCEGGTLIPSRFVAICAKGHVEDFPYSAWVHRGREVEGRHDLRLGVEGESGSLAGIVVECRTCEERRTMSGAFDRDALVGIRSCGGRRPWLSTMEPCGTLLWTAQRGASNVWFPIVRSVLSIPPWSDGLQRFVSANWGALRLELDPDAYRQAVEQIVAPAHVPYAAEEVIAAVAERKGEQRETRSDAQIRREEFRALCQGREETPEANFVATPREAPAAIAGLLDLATTVSRLREVRALTGFTRLDPSAAADKVCPLSRDADWLPAIAVVGEGIFLRFAEAALAAWEEQPQVRRRAATLRERWQDSYMFDGTLPDARFLLAHTFAHCLIDQWSLAGGYPAASLRERVYAVDEGVGVLVYTAAADSAGSLGGLIAEAAPGRLGPSLLEGVCRYRWCSSDPVCSETSAQGADGLNLAACHACALVPETSCEMRNGLLDRALLVGVPEDRDFGFFSRLPEA